MSYRIEDQEFAENDIGLIRKSRPETQEIDDEFLNVPGNRKDLITLEKFILKYSESHNTLLPALKYAKDWVTYVEEYNKTCNSYTKLQNLIRIYLSIEWPFHDVLKSANNSTDPQYIINILEAHLGKPKELIPYLEKFENVPKFSNDIREIPEIAEAYIEIIESLKLLNNVHFLNNNTAYEMVIDKMTDDLANKYYEFENNHYEHEDNSCYECREDRIKKQKTEDFCADDYDYIAGLIKLKNYFFHCIAICERFSSVLNMEKDKLTDETCVECQGNHGIEYCFAFHTMNDHGRVQVVHDHQLCHYCLKDIQHIRRPCVQKLCRLEDCGLIHHTLLHTYIPAFNLKSPKLDITLWRTVRSEKTKNGLLQLLEYWMKFKKSSLSFKGTRKEWIKYSKKYNSFSHLYTTFQNIGRIFISIEGTAKELMFTYLDNGVIRPEDMMTKYYEAIGRPTLEDLIIENLTDISNLTEKHGKNATLEFRRSVHSLFDNCISEELNCNQEVIDILIKKVQVEGFKEVWKNKKQHEINLKTTLFLIEEILSNLIK